MESFNEKIKRIYNSIKNKAKHKRRKLEYPLPDTDGDMILLIGKTIKKVTKIGKKPL